MSDISQETQETQGDIDMPMTPASMEAEITEKALSEETKEALRRITRAFPVIEMFGPTLQGEGHMAGVKTLFVRFGGCDYRCKMCDSLHAVIPDAISKHSKKLSAEQIVTWIKQTAEKTGCEWVTFSGGNPAIWDLSYVLELIYKYTSVKVAVETQGTVYNEYLSSVDVLTLSPKGPGMGEKFDPEVFKQFLQQVFAGKRFNPYSEAAECVLKVVVFNQMDLEFALSLSDIWLEAFELDSIDQCDGSFFLSLGNDTPPVLDAEFNFINPVALGNRTPLEHIGDLLTSYRSLSEDILQDPRFSYWRFLPQLHVLAWGNEQGY